MVSHVAFLKGYYTNACASEYMVANKTTHFQQYVFFIAINLILKLKNNPRQFC